MSSSPSELPAEPATLSTADAQPSEIRPADLAPPGATSPAGTSSGLRDSRWRPFLCCAGALGVGISLAPLLLKPPAVPPADARTSTPEIALAMEDTLVVSPAMPPGALLRGRVRLVAGETDVTGRARTGGQVARQLVASGSRVQQGDAVMEISSGAGQRVAPVSERRQNQAEQQQIAATDEQSALVQKINLAQTQLIAAQERVARAKSQTAVARDVVRRLQNGQNVSTSEIPAAFREANPSADEAPAKRSRASSRSSRDRTTSTSDPAASGAASGAVVSGAVQVAARQAEAARDAAQESAKSLQTARDTLGDAQSAARVADEKRESAAKAVASVEARFDAGKATGADVQAARAAQTEAQNAVDAADQALIFAKTEVGKREKNASAAQSYARSSADQAAKALATARLETPAAASNADKSSEAGNAAPAPSRGGAPSGAEGGVTLEGAIRFASAALDESRRASREAERISRQVEGYKSQVNQSHSRIEATTQGLAQAQQGVMDSVPRPRFTPCYAPSSGIITWMSRLAREVSEGDAVFGIARSQRAAARFEDKSGLWRAIKPGAILNAFVVDAPTFSGPQTADGGAPAPTPDKASGNSSSPVASEKAKGSADSSAVGQNIGTRSSTSGGESAGGSVITPDDIAKLGAGHALQLKMTQVESPATLGEAAQLTGAPLGSAGSEAVLTEGAQILVSLPLPNQKATLSVPTSALVVRGGATYVAVLAPLSPTEIAAQQASLPATRDAAPAAANGEGLPTASATPTPTPMGEEFHLRWTRVETGRSDGIRMEVRGGVAEGARVASQPEDLEAMGFGPPAQSKPTIIDKKSATPTTDAASNAAPGAIVKASPEVPASDAPEVDTEVLVRLTPAAA